MTENEYVRVNFRTKMVFQVNATFWRDLPTRSTLVRVFGPTSSATKSAANASENGGNELKFTYASSGGMRWMKNFWLCDDDTNYDTCTGYIKSVADFMAEGLNRTIAFKNGKADGANSALANGSWAPGVTRDVSMGEADFSISLWNAARCRSTACLGYLLESRYSAFVPTPPAKNLFAAYVEPFSLPAWIAILTTFLAIGTFMSIFKTHYFQDFSWLGLYATLVGQDFSARISTGYSRTAGGKSSERTFAKNRPKLRFFPMGPWHTGITVLFVCYSATVIQHFMDQRGHMMGSLEEVFVRRDYNMTMSAALLSFFLIASESKHPALHGINDRMTLLNSPPASYYPLPNEAFMDDSNFLLLRSDGLRVKGDQRWKQFYMVTDVNLLPRRYRTVFFNKAFSRMKKANRLSRLLMEHGFNTYFERIYLSETVRRMRSNFKDVNVGQDLAPIPLGKVYAWFTCLFIGLSLAFAVFLAEFVWKSIGSRFYLPSNVSVFQSIL